MGDLGCPAALALVEGVSEGDRLRFEVGAALEGLAAHLVPLVETGDRPSQVGEEAEGEIHRGAEASDGHERKEDAIDDGEDEDRDGEDEEEAELVTRKEFSGEREKMIDRVVTSASPMKIRFVLSKGGSLNSSLARSQPSRTDAVMIMLPGKVEPKPQRLDMG